MDGAGDICVILTSEDDFGDSGFEGCVSIISKGATNLRPHYFNKGWGT